MTPDLCILGMDTAGYDLALASAQLGARVVVVPHGRETAQIARDHLTWLDDPAVRRATSPASFAQALRQALATQGALRGIERLRGLGVQVTDGAAAFTSPRSLRVGEVTISARRFVLAAGRRSAAFPQDQSEGLNPLLTGAFLADAPAMSFPRAVRVVGRDARAPALAQRLSRSGTAVVLDMGSGLLPDDDPEAVDLLIAALRSEGVRLVSDDQPADDDVTLMHSIVSDTSPPAIDGLALDVAGVALRDGEVVFDSGLRTSNPRIFGIGAITARAGEHDPGPGQIGHLIGRTLFLKGGAWVAPFAVRRVASDPELVTYGLTEAEARQQGHAVAILREPLPGTPGLIKAVLDRKGRILGVSVIGENALALAGVWAAPVAKRGTLADLASLPAFPGQAVDASRLIAGVPQRKMLASRRLQRLLRVLRKFG